MREIRGRTTAWAKCRQHIRHVFKLMIVSIAQGFKFVFEFGENGFKLVELYSESKKL